MSGSGGSGPRAHWSGSLGFLLAAAGSAIGLGNIWKFPYVTGTNGGGAFVLVYLGCIFAVGIPIFIAELYVGQKTQCDAIRSFQKLDGKGTVWQIAGWLGVVSAFLILSFYSVVGGWVLDYEFMSLGNAFAGKSSEDVGKMLDYLFANPVRQVLWHAVFMALTIGIVMGGIKGGIEKWSRILMPALLAIMAFLLVYCLFLDGFGRAISFMFKPDFSALSANAILIAVGQAFFTLSLGMGCMITYGSYLKDSEDLVKTGIMVALADTSMAILSGIIVFSIVFSFGLEPGAGPGLIFVTLPTLFSQMTGGYFLAVLFFLLVGFAALSSAISLLEVVVTYWVDEKGMSRKKTAILAGSIIWLLGLLSALSFNLLSDAKIGKFTFFDFFDGITTNIFLPFGGLVISLFFGWVLGMKAIDGCLKGRGGPVLSHGLLWTVRLFAPFMIGWVLYTGGWKWVYHDSGICEAVSGDEACEAE